MSLKTIRAPSMAAALAEVKREVGPDAVILRTRTLKAGGVMGLGARSMIEVTASTAEEAPPMPRRRPPRRETPQATPDTTPDTTPGTTPLTETRPTVAGTTGAGPAGAGAYESPIVHRSPALDALVTPVRPNPQTDAARRSLEDEIAGVKRLVGQLLHATRTGPAPIMGGGGLALGLGGASDTLHAAYARLVDSELSPDLADAVLSQVRRELSEGEAEDAEIVDRCVVRLLAGRLRADPGALESPSRGARIAFVGPTGVGKTTSIAKLAATYQLRRGLSVGLITADTYRIAAVEQLRTYAGIIGVPLRVALTPEELSGAIESLADRDILLIDTAGRSPRNTSRLEELSAFVRAAAPEVTCLALSAAASERTLRGVIERFEPLRPDAFALTKLDEAETIGPALSAVAGCDRPIAMLSTGQEVPDQFEWARADRLAHLAYGGSEALADIAQVKDGPRT